MGTHSTLHDDGKVQSRSVTTPSSYWLRCGAWRARLSRLGSRPSEPLTAPPMVAARPVAGTHRPVRPDLRPSDARPSAATFSRTCSGVTARGMALTQSSRSTHDSYMSRWSVRKLRSQAAMVPCTPTAEAPPHWARWRWGCQLRSRRLTCRRALGPAS